MGRGETENYGVDFLDLVKIILKRIEKIEPENVIKIVGYLFLNEHDLLQLAFGPDNIFLSKISNAKAMLNMLSTKTSVPDTQSINGTYLPDTQCFLSPPGFPPHWDPSHELVVRDRFVNLYDQAAPNFFQDAVVPSRVSRRTPSLQDFPIKACHYFSKGYCKHGSNCRYFHVSPSAEGYSSVYLNGNEIAEENGYVSGSLEKLEMEITELLKSRKGPVSIASLPTLYLEMYGKNLQAEGYLTESQRHGKSGYSLTKLLARLKSISLIDRPHGQHSVVLADEASKYMEGRNDRADPGPVVASSHQIYMTFPAESGFTETDVSDYFGQFGPVRDVRIPSQERRMFGFVSFLYSDTVVKILTKKNPHYICNARVLVKPYRDKSSLIDRNCIGRNRPPTFYPYADMDLEFHSLTREPLTSRMFKKQQMDENELLMHEFEMKRASEISFIERQHDHHSYFSSGGDEFKNHEDHNGYLDHFANALEALKNGSTSDHSALNNGYASNGNGYDDHDCDIELPESPFASAE